MFSTLGSILPADGKKWSKEKLASRLEEAAGIMKSVYRSVLLTVGHTQKLSSYQQRTAYLRPRHTSSP